MSAWGYGVGNSNRGILLWGGYYRLLYLCRRIDNRIGTGTRMIQWWLWQRLWWKHQQKWKCQRIHWVKGAIFLPPWSDPFQVRYLQIAPDEEENMKIWWWQRRLSVRPKHGPRWQLSLDKRIGLFGRVWAISEEVNEVFASATEEAETETTTEG